MKVLELDLKNYRNLKDGKFEPSPTVNVIYGENAQGKTNLIESMWLFTGGKSFRSTKDADLIRFGERNSELKMKVNSQNRDQAIMLNLGGQKRKVEINNVKKSSPSELIGKFCAVVFSPTHLSMIKDGPNQRRRFLDAAICQLYPAYTKNLIKYNKIVDQRNALLKNNKKTALHGDTITVWDEYLANYAAEITQKRLEYIDLLQTHACEVYRGITSGVEKLFLQYRSVAVREQNVKKEDLVTRYTKIFKESQKEDFLMGFTTKGPHRDDIDIKIDNKSAKLFGSQGQQRSAVLALKLAETKIIGKEKGENPVVLLDDVMSELDTARQSYIMNALCDLQVFITCCNPETLSLIKDGSTFLIEKGELR